MAPLTAAGAAGFERERAEDWFSFAFRTDGARAQTTKRMALVANHQLLCYNSLLLFEADKERTSLTRKTILHPQNKGKER